MKSKKHKKRTIIIVKDLQLTGGLVEDIASFYRFPRHHSLAFSFQYVRDMLTDFLPGAFDDYKVLFEIIDQYNKGYPLTLQALRGIFFTFHNILFRAETDVMVVDQFFMNSETIPLWKEEYRNCNTTFVYLEVGPDNQIGDATGVRYLMQENKINVEWIKDSTQLAVQTRKKLLAFIPD